MQERTARHFATNVGQVVTVGSKRKTDKQELFDVWCAVMTVEAVWLLQVLRNECAAANTQVALAKEEVARVEGELREYRARAHSLLQRKEEELRKQLSNDGGEAVDLEALQEAAKEAKNMLVQVEARKREAGDRRRGDDWKLGRVLGPWDFCAGRLWLSNARQVFLFRRGRKEIRWPAFSRTQRSGGVLRLRRRERRQLPVRRSSGGK